MTDHLTADSADDDMDYAESSGDSSPDGELNTSTLDDDLVESPDDSETDDPDDDDDGRAQIARDRSLLRRALRKRLQLEGLGATSRSLLAAAIGEDPDDTDAMTVTVMTGASVARGSTLDTLRDLAKANPVEAGAMATTMGREDLKAVFGMLVALNAAPTKRLSSSHAKAAVAVAIAAGELDDGAMELVERAKDASRRTT